jgi:hypothetical protein
MLLLDISHAQISIGHNPLLLDVRLLLPPFGH